MYASISIDSEDFRGQLTLVSEEKSVHTGRQLWQGEMHVQLPVDMARELSNGPAREVMLALEEDDVRQVSVHVSSWSQNSGSSRALASLRLDEVESVQASRLDFEGLSLEPYHYVERAECDGQAIVINAWVRATNEDHERLRDLWVNRGYMPVVRVGVSEVPRSMRLGQPQHTPDEEGYRYHLVLVDEAYDELDDRTGYRGLDGPMAEGARARLAEQIGFLDALVERLTTRGALTEEEVEEARVAARTTRRRTMYSFLEDTEVDDLQ